MWSIGDAPQDDRGALVVLYCEDCQNQWLSNGHDECPDCCGDNVTSVPPDDIDDWDILNDR